MWLEKYAKYCPVTKLTSSYFSSISSIDTYIDTLPNLYILCNNLFFIESINLQ